MAAPASAIQEKIRGLREAKAAFQALPQIVRDNMLAAAETTVREIARGAKARIEASPSIHTKALLNAIGWRVTKTNGRARVGVENQSAGKVNPARRAHFVEFGTVNMPAEPFMLPAAEAETQPHLARCRAAGKGIERDTRAIGMRGL